MNQSAANPNDNGIYGCCRYILSAAPLRVFSIASVLFAAFFSLPAPALAQSGIKFTPPAFSPVSQTITIPKTVIPPEAAPLPFPVFDDNIYSNDNSRYNGSEPVLRFEKNPAAPHIRIVDSPLTDISEEPLSPPRRLIPETSDKQTDETYRKSLMQRTPMPLPVLHDSDELAEVFQTGRLLEEKSHWSDALTHYEIALRTYRNDSGLMNRFRIARFHYDVSRRFHDSSYLKTLQSVSFVEALRQYDEIIFRLQSNYIETLDWDEFFRYGMQDVEIALGDSYFRKENGLEDSSDKIEKFIADMNQTAAGWEIRNKEDLRNAVLYIVETSMKQLSINPVVLLMEFTCGIVNSLDPYTSYLTPGQLADTHAMISGKFVGLGIQLKSDSESLYVVRVIPNSPAQQAGLRGGDRIHFVNGIATKGKDTDTAGDLLQGKDGTMVKLTVQHYGETDSKEYDIVRRKIEVSSVEGVRFLDKGIGYVKLTGFQSNTCAELRNAIASLERQGMSRLVLDLRHNPGGLLQMGVEVADMFIEDGVIVRTRGRQSTIDTPYMATKKNTLNMPLIVLIDGESASASEIVAGAIRDHERGVIIGTRSYGKGTIQEIIPIDSGRTNVSSAGLRMTVEKFFSPLGKAYSGMGVEPDHKVDLGTRVTAAKPFNGKVPVPLPALNNLGTNKDPVIQKAIEIAPSLAHSNVL
ncbi:MAG: S41 family peptidase [Planctomycetaceae bacterium]|nr:S41 family peptidase [Planctomycetaceae bacterium]